MQGFIRLIAVLVLILVLAAAASARVATIRTAAPITEPSAAAVPEAFVEAVKATARGAMAMGLPRVSLRQALLPRNAVLGKIVATDAADADEADANGREPVGESDRAGMDREPRPWRPAS